ncbi:hypothetical protein [Sphingomonas adhaesiva]|uniref:hypothetical protein n=1 Tax=Sphingomonas adhaesiva TaxID=28212 RepID=UPI002FFBD32D
MTEEASPFEVFRCPSCNKPTTATLPACRHCSAVLSGERAGETAGFLERVFGITSPAGRIGCIATAAAPLVIGMAFLALPDRKASNPGNGLSMPPVSSAEMVKPAPVASYTTYSALEKAKVCRAATAMMFGRDVNTINATQVGGLTRISYRRPDDNKLWKLDCQLDDEFVVWRPVDAFGNDGPGRWRTSPEDDKMTFVMEGRMVAITLHYVDGSTATETYRF